MTRLQHEHRPIPFAIQRAIRQYRPELREEITRAVQEHMAAAEQEGRRILPEEIGECAARIIFGTDRYNQDTERLCLDAYDRGDRTTLREVIDDLRAYVSGSAEG